MSTTTTNRALYDAFLDLVCDDQELIDAEFDELIAASWTPPPPAPHAFPEPADGPGPSGFLAPTRPSVPGRPTAPRAQPPRQRSPPRTRRTDA